MELDYIKLSDAVAKLLKEDNKDKNLGEVSAELNNYLIEIKDLVETNEISYDQLKKEIQKHIDYSEDIKPGSVAQLLMGCVNENECPLQKEQAMDISFIYDYKTNKILPLTNITTPVTEDSYCIIYINGDLDSVKLEPLMELEKRGFNKIKIKHKKPSESIYKTMDVSSIQEAINMDKGISKSSLLIALFLIIILLIYMFKK